MEGTFESGIKRTIAHKIKYAGQKNEESLFTILFDEETDSKVTQEAAFDVYRAYMSSTYFYFHESDANDEEEEGEEAGAEE